MYEIPDIHLSLDTARETLNRRWRDADLRQAVEEELGGNFMSQFKTRPRAVSFRQLASPDNGFMFFIQAANYIGAMPLVLEYHEDMFTHLNEEKKGLGRLHVTTENRAKARFDIMDFHANEKKSLGACTLKGGERLVDFHHRLFDLSGHKVELLDNSAWFKGHGKPKDFYHDLFLHYIAHGVALESLFDETPSGVAFLEEIVVPVIEKIERGYGLKPLVVRQYPTEQTEEEDFYWWSYPPDINRYLFDYARKHRLKIKPCSVGSKP
jgi:hypothetical protein